ncbi:DUF932 domain-containing protein [Vibrio vulnificus]|nr:DUF932 domain-containing protein [Vibrio vulnificus]
MNMLTRFSTSDLNNIANPTNWQHLCIDDRTNSNIHFDVAIADLSDFLNNGMQTNGEQAVYDVQNNQLIAVHGKSYELVKNAVAYDACNAVINQLGESGLLNVEGMFIKDAVVNRGGKTIRQYIFPNHSVSMPNGDLVLLRLVIINSYDGSCNFSVQAGGFRIVCTNGLVTGSKFMSVNMRHTKSICLQNIQSRLTHSVSSFSRMGDYWHELINTPITRKHADLLLANFSSEKGEVSVNKFLALSDQYKAHARDLGENYWSLYNTLTAYSTHYGVLDSNAVNLEDVRLRREGEVNQLLRSKEWAVKMKA